MPVMRRIIYDFDIVGDIIYPYESTLILRCWPADFRKSCSSCLYVAFHVVYVCVLMWESVIFTTLLQVAVTL
jgi:hypothetical protein